MNDITGNIYNNIKLKFPFLLPIFEIFSLLFLPITGCVELADVTVSLFGKKMTVVDFSYINNLAGQWKPWIAGLIWMLVLAFAVKKVSAILSSNGGGN